MTWNFIIGSIIVGNSGTSIADFEFQLSMIVSAGAPVLRVVPPTGSVGGDSKAGSSWSGGSGRAGSVSMASVPSSSGCSRVPSRSDVGAAPSRGVYRERLYRGGIEAGLYVSSSSAGLSRSGVGAGPSRGGTAASSCRSNVSGHLQASGRGGSSIPDASVTQRGAEGSRSGSTDSCYFILFGQLNMVLD